MKKKKNKCKEEEISWAWLEFNHLDEENNLNDEQFPNRSEDESESSGPFFGFDFQENDADHNSQNDDNSENDDTINDDENDDYDSDDNENRANPFDDDVSAASGQSTSTHNLAIDTSHSLDWDNHSMTVNLSDPLDRTNLFSIPDDEFCRDESYTLDEVFIPNLQEPDSPPSPYLRFTRNTLRMGTFVRPNDHTRVSTVSSTNSEFLRNNPLRRPFVKAMKDDDISPITDTASAQLRSRRKTKKPAKQKKYPQ